MNNKAWVGTAATCLTGAIVLAPSASAEASGDGSGVAVPDGAISVSTEVDPDGFVLDRNGQWAGKGSDLQAADTSSVPSCVGFRDLFDIFNGGRVYIDNNCAGSVRVKILIAFGVDSECKTVESHTTQEHGYDAEIARFDGAVTC